MSCIPIVSRIRVSIQRAKHNSEVVSIELQGLTIAVSNLETKGQYFIRIRTIDRTAQLPSSGAAFKRNLGFLPFTEADIVYGIFLRNLRGVCLSCRRYIDHRAQADDHRQRK